MKNILIFQLAFFAICIASFFGIYDVHAQTLEASPNTVDFGEVNVNTSKKIQISLTNRVDASLTSEVNACLNASSRGSIMLGNFSSNAPFVLDREDCSRGRFLKSTNPSCSFSISFNPVESGTLSKVMTVPYTAMIGTSCSVVKEIDISITGTGKDTEAPTPPPAPPTPPSSGSCPSGYSCKDGCGDGEASGGTCNFNNQGADTGICCKSATGGQTVSCTENEQPKRKGVCKTECNATSEQALRDNTGNVYTSTPANCGNTGSATDIACCVPSMGDSAKTCSDQGGTCGAAACTGEEIMRSSDCDSEGQHCCKSAGSGDTCDAANCKPSCNSTTEDSDSTCAAKVCTTDPKNKEYCKPKSTTPPPGGGSGPAPEIKVIEFKNPLSLNTVDALLTSILSALRGVIVTLSIIFIVIGAVLYITSAGNEKQSGMAKKAITASMIGLAIGIAAPSFLKEIYKILSADQTLPPDAAAAPSIAIILGNTLSFLLGIVGVLALIMLVVGGAIFLTASGDEKKLDTGKKIFKFALIGIIVALAALVLTGQIADFFV